MAAKVTSPILKCDGHAGYPKYVFVLSLENRSFDHLFGRSNITGKDAATKAAGKRVNGVLDANGNLDPQYTNSYGGKSYGVPNADAPFIMPSDPKHEFEHILCQTCGQAACKTLMTEFKAGPDSYGTNEIPASFYDSIPPPPQSQPQWVRFTEKLSPAQGNALRPGSVSARPAPDNSGFVHSYARSYSVNNIEKAADVPDLAASCPDPGLVMACFNTPTQLPILHQLASNFVICDNFFSSLPGPTGPNRFFMMAGSSAGYDGGPSSGDMMSWSTTGHLPVTKGNIFTHLEKAKVPFRIYGDDNVPMAGVMEGVHSTNTFDVHNHATSISSLQTELKEATNDKPFPYNFVWIEPDYDVASSMVPLHKHPMYSTGNSMHPCSDVRKAEQLIADLYNWISGNASVWQNCVFIITWDEHGGFYDHVVSPPATPPGDSPSIGRTWSFKFDRLGTRVPCLLISPFIESNLVDSRQYDHGSILKTVVDLYNKGAFTKGAAPANAMQPWTNRISAAASMIDLFTADVAKAQTVALGTPLEPAPAPEVQVAEQPPASQDKPTGNTPIFLAAAMNLHQSADPSVNLPETAAGLTTNAAAADYFKEAAAAVDDAQSQAA